MLPRLVGRVSTRIDRIEVWCSTWIPKYCLSWQISFAVAAFQNIADGPGREAVAALQVQVAPVRHIILGERE